ncbi:MAG TPA: NAD(P)H-dependent oxidoreductase [Candidatus Magasanikbacteria bacterium]|nr:NAD(P)H-dependent oxidoreductase [Candidatus Magasanikbacteria bacterium]
MFIPVILGTAREGRQSEKAAKFVLEEVLKYGLESELLDVRDYLFGLTDSTKQTDSAKKFAQKLTTAAGLIIVAPEYNHGYPGELKLMLDSLYQEYAGKLLGICGVSAGGLGGSRMVEQLRQVAIEFRLIPIREAVYFSGIQNLFEGDKIKDPSLSGRIKTMLDELVSYAKKLNT